MMVIGRGPTWPDDAEQNNRYDRTPPSVANDRHRIADARVGDCNCRTALVLGSRASLVRRSRRLLTFARERRIAMTGPIAPPPPPQFARVRHASYTGAGATEIERFLIDARQLRISVVRRMKVMSVSSVTFAKSSPIAIVHDHCLQFQLLQIKIKNAKIQKNIKNIQKKNK